MLVPTVLVASDTYAVRRTLASDLESNEIAVRQASSGPEVLKAVAADPPDLVIVDMQMGNMGGMAVCLELRLEESYGKLPHVPVLMLVDRRPDVFLARRSGAEGWLVKPIDALRLRQATRTLLAGGEYHDDSYLPTPVRSGAEP